MIRPAFVLYLLLISQPSTSLNFLIIHPFYAGSHVLTLHSVASKLVENGHNVTTIRFRDQHNLTLRSIGSLHKEVLLSINNSDGRVPFITREEEGAFQVPMDLLWKEGLSILSILKLPGSPWTVVEEHCAKVLSPEVRAMVREGQFDLMLVDLVYNECSLALAHHLGIPTAGYWAFSFSGGECELSSVSTMPSHIPTFLSRLSSNMNFLERTYNFLNKLIFGRLFIKFHCWLVDGYIHKYLITDKVMPSAEELVSNVNGLLINSNDIIDYPRLKADSAINIGGMQIRKERTPLPRDLLEWIEGAPNGVIILSMGFIFDMTIVPKKMMANIFNAFKRLPYRFIVKIESEVKDLPSNVLTSTFLPQQDILNHPKTLAFFTHCGMHGVLEAIYFGVPMIGMPIFIDQGDVATRLQEKEIAVILSKFASEDEIHDAILEVTSNERYKNNVDSLSALFKLQRHHPIDDATWFLEYLALTKGAKHMLLGGRNLNFLQYFSLDVIIFLLVLFLISLRFVVFIFRKRQKVKKD